MGTNASVYNCVLGSVRLTYGNLSEGQITAAVTSMAANARHASVIRAVALEDSPDITDERLPPELTAAIAAHIQALYPCQRMAAYDSDDDEVPYAWRQQA